MVEQLVSELSNRRKKAISGARVLLFGTAFEKDVEDVRESPAFKLIELFEGHGVRVDFHDPFVPVGPNTREHTELAGRKRFDLNADVLESYDVGLICTDHTNVDYEEVVKSMDLVVDTRNATKAILNRSNVVPA